MEGEQAGRRRDDVRDGVDRHRDSGIGQRAAGRLRRVAFLDVERHLYRGPPIQPDGPVPLPVVSFSRLVPSP